MALIYGAEWGLIGPVSRGIWQCADCKRCAEVWLHVQPWTYLHRVCLEHMDQWIRNDCYARALSQC